MNATELRELLVREPFERFRLRLSNGEAYAVSDRQSVAVMRNRLFIALPDREKWVFVQCLHIAAVESLRNGHSTRRRRRPR